MNQILLAGLCFIGLQAHAEQPVVIDAESVTAQPTAASAQYGSVTAGAQADANAANRERILKGGNTSRREKREVAKAAMADTNLQAGGDFMATNRSRPGVVSLPSGVQYKVLRAGKGKTPTENSQVRCRYKGTLIDGSAIDRSDDRKPSSLHVSGFVQGLREAVTLMPTGSKWQIVIPPQLAYGARGYHAVGPNAVVIYEMEILGVK